MQTRIISAYLGHTGEVVAICSNSYYVLNKKLDIEKAQIIVNKINSIRSIETEHWTEMK